jgi:hypothetical protein
MNSPATDMGALSGHGTALSHPDSRHQHETNIPPVCPLLLDPPAPVRDPVRSPPPFRGIQ